MQKESEEILGRFRIERNVTFMTVSKFDSRKTGVCYTTGSVIQTLCEFTLIYYENASRWFFPPFFWGPWCF